MNLWHNLHSECIAPRIDAKDKKQLLSHIATVAVAAPELKIIGKERILKALTERERIGSTGLQDGIAIPHCSFEEVTDFIVGVVTTKDPIDFGAFDNKGSDIFIFLIGPTDNRNKHIRLLSSISKAVKERSVRDQLRRAESVGQISDVFDRFIEYSEPGFSGQGKSQITIYIQKEDHFNEILEVISSETDGSVAVIETENANQYLYHMPLFAAFWNESRRSFSRIIIAVVARESVNSVLRQVQTIVPDMEMNRGLMITVNDLAFAIGAIDF